MQHAQEHEVTHARSIVHAHVAQQKNNTTQYVQKKYIIPADSGCSIFRSIAITCAASPAQKYLHFFSVCFFRHPPVPLPSPGYECIVSRDQPMSPPVHAQHLGIADWIMTNSSASCRPSSNNISSLSRSSRMQRRKSDTSRKQTVNPHPLGYEVIITPLHLFSVAQLRPLGSGG